MRRVASAGYAGGAAAPGYSAPPARTAPAADPGSPRLPHAGGRPSPDRETIHSREQAVPRITSTRC